MAARGGLLKLLDAYVAIGGDAADFDKVVDQSEAKAKAAGSRLESALSPRRVLGALGAAAGAVFGIAMTGANQLDDATKRLVADTGLTGKAAEDAGHSIASLYENNLQGFDAIGAAMAKVHNDLGLTGAAADAATEKFLKFSTATGQDAAGAVTSFDDILDAWNLTAADAGSIMDKLVVSHQKFGGVIAESESALSAMAPAMQAANMSIDDGIALLNLFNAAGIDAAKAPAALAKAVKALKPGQDLNDLIAQIGAIEDPTLRGQKAMEIFGARSGIGLAQAIKPGMTSLADLTASLGDTAVASDKAAEASLSWGDKATLAMHKVGGALAEIGTQFGPLLMVAATIGPKFTTAIMAALGGIGGLVSTQIAPQLAGALTSNVAPWMTAGTKAATIFGAGMTVALPLIAAAAVVAAWAIINDGLNKQADAVATHTAEFVKTATLEQLKASRDAIAKGYQDIANLPLGTLLYGDQLASLKRDFDAVDAAIAALDAKTAGLTGTELDLSRGALAASRATADVGSAAAKAGPKVDVLADSADRAKSAMEVMGDKFKATWSELGRIASGAADDIFGPQIRASDMAANEREQAAQRAIIASKKSTAAEKQDARDRLLALQKEGLGIQIEMAGRGELTKTAYATLISKLQTQAKSGNAEIANSARIALAELAQLKAAASAIPNLPAWLTRSYSGSAAGGRAAGGPVTAGMPYIVNENTPRSEWFVPAVSGTILTADQAASQDLGRGGGGDTFSPTVNVNVSAGSDVSPGAARRFGQAVADEVAQVLRQQSARRGLVGASRP